MRLKILDNKVFVECSGLEYLNLKAAIYKRIGALLRVEKNLLVFSSNALPLIEDLLTADAKSNSDIEAILNVYGEHCIARENVLRILEQQLTEGVSVFWQQQLELAQAVAVSAMIVPNLLGLCLFDEQGSGKTVMTIAAFDLLKSAGIIDSMIVVCPKSMMSEWPKDVERFLPGKYSIEIAEGSKESKYRLALKNFDLLVTNYEGVEHMRVALSASASNKAYLLVVDESYYLKNEKAIRSESVNQLRDKCSKCYVLCGTPAPNSAYDLINQFNLADLGYTFSAFKKANDPDKDRDRISELIEQRGTFIRRVKSDILEHVPEKNFHVIRIPLTGRQALMYEKARKDLEIELRGLDNTTFKKRLTTYFQRRAVLLQICSNPVSVDPTMTELSVKFKYLDELLDKLVPQGRKVVIWSFYKQSLDELMTRYAHYNPVRIDGSVNTKLRREAVKLFQESTDRMLFIGNPAAAGAGITLHASYDAVYISYSNQAAHYLQSLDRIHRRGQVSNEVNYYLLVCEETIEETEILRLRGKELDQHSLLGDYIPWPTSLDEALKELSEINV